MIRSYLLAFMLLAAFHLNAQDADIRLLRTIHSSEALACDPVFLFITNSHAYIVAGVPLTMGATALLTDNDELLQDAIELGVATGLNYGFTQLLKYTIQRDRPFTTYPDILPKAVEESPSFPSAHTASAFATATSLSLLYPKWYVIAPSYIWAGSVGYSRMYLGLHYPSDVLAGALLGAGSSWLTHEVNRWYQKKQPFKHGKFE
jgi:membrane-associated phospholipid phosphatase